MKAAILFFIFLAIASVACKSPSTATSGAISSKSDDSSVGEETKSSESILFVMFDMFREGDDYSVLITDEKLVEGRLFQEDDTPLSGHLKVEIRDASGESLRLLYPFNPLDREIENFGDDGVITSESVRLDSGSFFIRTNYSERFHSVSIYRPLESGDFEFLTNLQLLQR